MAIRETPAMPCRADARGNNLQYDDEMLNSHFITGDGRGNENIGLTAVHTIFHSEHNRLVEANKDTIIASGDAAVVNEWLPPGLATSGAISQPARRNQHARAAEAAPSMPELGWRAPVPGGALRHRNAISASRVRGVRTPHSAERRSVRVHNSATSTRRSSRNSPIWSTASGTRC